MHTETADWVGLTLDGRYLVTGRLGEGGMGFVYRARDSRLDCDVVVKVPRAAMLEDAGFRERFKAEVGALVKLAHPHVVKVTDFGQHEGVPFAVMQYLPGGSLEDRRPKDTTGHFKAIASKSLNEWLLPVAEALDFIHKQGYVHRDVKPANILFDAHRNAYISDFGVAKAVAGNKPAGAGVTGTGMILGTPTYMAPELVLGNTFDGRIDQYALAITVFELLAGRPPFDEPTPMATLIKRTTEEPPALAEARPGTGASLSAAIDKAMSRDPAQRYPTCAAFAKAVLAAAARTSNAPIAHASGSPARETPRTGVPHTKAEGYNIVGSVPPSMGKRSKHGVAAVVEIDDVKVAKKTKTHDAEESSGKTGLILVLAGGSAVVAGLVGIIIWLVMARGGDHPSNNLATANNSNSEATNSSPRNSSVNTPRSPRTPVAGVPARGSPPGSPKVIDLRPAPATIELLAGGPWVPINVAVERTGTGPVTVELTAPSGVEVKSNSVVVEQNEPARFDLRATATAVISRGMNVRLTVRDTNVRRTIPVILKRLDFHVSLASEGEIGLLPGQEKTVEFRIDRSGGYAGALTLTIPASPVACAATVQVPADATTATIPLTAQANARPGGVTVRVVVAAADGGTNHELGILVRVPPTVEVRSFAGHTGMVHAVSLSADGKLAISGGADGTVRLWDTTTGKEKWKGESHIGAVLSVAFSADATQAISGGADRTVRLWEVSTGTSRAFSVGTTPDPGHGAAVWFVRFDDAKHVHSVSADKSIHWVIATGKPRQVADGRRDLILGQKYKADIAPGVEVKPGTRFPSDSGEFLVSGVGTTMAMLWRRGATDKTPPRSIGHTAILPSPIKLLAVSGDGARLLTVCDNNSVRLWETIPTSTVARPAKAVAGFPWIPDYDSTCAALDTDGKHVLLGGPGGTLKLWRLP